MRVSGAVRVPGDKSISHRALLLAAMGDGPSRVRGILDSADVRATAGALRAMGVDVPELAPDMVVVGRGARGLAAPSRDLDCANSGTTTRLTAGLVAAHPFAARFVGDASLSRRPMGRVARPLEAMGARVAYDGEAGRLPMTVHGGDLRDLEWTSETSSAQVKSAILLAGVAAGVEVTVREPHRSRDHTERMLAARGVDVWVHDRAVHVPTGARVAPLDAAVPGDPSSAAFFAALGALAGAGELVLPEVCLNPTRTGFFFVLARMGARLTVDDERREGGEDVGTVLVAAGTPLRGTVVEPHEVPAMIDELPLLACLAACAEGETRVTGASELRVKESDRIAAVVANLRALDVDADELPDGFVVRGRGPRAFRGAVATHADHRLAMGFGILGALPGSDVRVDDPACVDVSFPGFWDALRTATAA
ncbi:3-phosphoshikimate 1-carboxyvinyltransferase [Roseisolibacter sp. H3M3-2]|uniref:3-phosphoshikimate 1-carboxyvinyltransferase n=1 Tax=Roseisolibacter sp. H3M3-2 TaxID=3031323 RepID=UPI0023DA6A2F|nr:3-phosphoshikimate 1-carboxyvinyltransferase [Roseisolibacter sp. H3M3-2]MDF1502050.1 3-phosphoshikimate 1-carboxyvinyltransferase [Roseisolibacter sp. H3M3-2]